MTLQNIVAFCVALRFRVVGLRSKVQKLVADCTEGGRLFDKSDSPTVRQPVPVANSLEQTYAKGIPTVFNSRVGREVLLN